MAKFILGKLKQEQKGWKEAIIDRINQGKVLPFISNNLCNELVFGNNDELIEGFAEYLDYPRPDKKDLTRIMQYQSVMLKADPEVKADDVYIKEVYLDFLKKALASIADEDAVEELQEEANLDKLTFSEVADRLDFPRFDEGQKNPFLLLADLPLPIYLTTGYHTFMEAALQKAGKKPRTEICYWNKRLKSVPSVFETDKSYQPSPQEPIVYHLHGLDKYPGSLVATEDDHLDFLVNISQDWDGIPLPIRQALADSSILMLGYGLRNWDFRVLFRGMIKTSIDQRRPKSVSIQLQGDDQEKNYLQNYLNQEAEFEVYWGDALHFMQELWQGWAS